MTVPVWVLLGFAAWTSGIEIATLIAILLILATCFITGLIMRTQIGVRSRKLVERIGLNRLPGYTLVKSLTQSFAGAMEGSTISVAIAANRDCEVLAFIVEEHDNGDYTGFVPNAPTPTIGTIYFLKREKVRQLDVPMAAGVDCIMQRGVGSKSLLAKAS